MTPGLTELIRIPFLATSRHEHLHAAFETIIRLRMFIVKCQMHYSRCALLFQQPKEGSKSPYLVSWSIAALEILYEMAPGYALSPAMLETLTMLFTWHQERLIFNL